MFAYDVVQANTPAFYSNVCSRMITSLNVRKLILAVSISVLSVL